MGTAYGMSTQTALFKCLKTFQRGYHLDCSGRDHFCCQYFQRKSSKSHRRAKVLEPKKKIIDYDFKKLHQQKKHFNELLEEGNEVEHNEITAKPIIKNQQQNLEKQSKLIALKNKLKYDLYEAKFNGGQRRGIVLSENKPKNETLAREDKFQKFFSDHDHVLIGDRGYDRDLCASLRVPCRFVNDHPCCQYEMPLDLVARARALDGSADLKWRPKSLGGPRTSNGRSLFSAFTTPTLPPSLINKDIKYNFAKSKKKVQIPKYHYDGGPEMTSTIVGLCWRLHYLKCPSNITFSEGQWIDSRNLKKIHPCCQLVNKPVHNSPVQSRLAKWLNLVP